VKTLRLVTLNLWNKSGPWLERRASICEELGEHAPDLVGFQELLRLVPDGDPGALPGAVSSAGPGPAWSWTAQDDQLTEIEGALRAAGGAPQSLAFVAAKSYGGGLVMGNGLMSRFPLLDVRGYALPGEESGETRSLLYALLDTPGGRLPTFVTHLNWKWHHGAVRLRQVQAIAEHIEALHPSTETPADDVLPPVLLGDFNAEPDADEIRYLRGLHTLEGKSVHFADAWIWAGDGGPGYTFERANGFAARSNEPPRRIDYVFVRGPDERLRGEPLEARRAFMKARERVVEGGEAGGGGKVERIWPSDHYGLVVDLAVSPREARN